jgi:hypothetical protein
MKGIELLPLADDARKKIETFALQYRKNAHVIMEVISFRANRLIVRVEQKELMGGAKLSKTDLVKRVRDMFAGEIPAGWKLTVSAVDFDRRDIDGITPENISARMALLGLRPKHVSSHTGIDKSTISSILGGDKPLTKWHKVAFYYFFKYYELANFDVGKTGE